MSRIIATFLISSSLLCVMLWALTTSTSGQDATEVQVGKIVSSQPGPFMPGEQIGLAIPVTGPVNAMLAYTWTDLTDSGVIVMGQGMNGIVYEASTQPGEDKIRVQVQVGNNIYTRETTLNVRSLKSEPPNELYATANELTGYKKIITETWTFNGAIINSAVHTSTEWGLSVNIEQALKIGGKYQVTHRYKLKEGTTAQFGVYNQTDHVDVIFDKHTPMKADGRYHTEIAGYFYLDCQNRPGEAIGSYYWPSAPNALTVEWVFFERVEGDTTPASLPASACPTPTPSPIQSPLTTSTLGAVPSSTVPIILPAKGLVGWWKFDECNGLQVADSTMNNHSGELMSSNVTFTPDAVSGCALKFKGANENDIVGIAHDPAFEPANGTLEVWVKIPQLPLKKDTQGMPLVGKTNGLSGKGWAVYDLRIMPDGSIGSLVGDSTGALTPHTEPDVIKPDHWYHLAVTWDRKFARVFVDGGEYHASQGCLPSPCTGLAYGGATYLIFGPQYADSTKFTGQLDEVRFYNRALTPDEIHTDYEATKPKVDCTIVTEIPSIECEALVALYKSTDGPNWITKTNWLVTNTPCSAEGRWYGMTCANGHVTGLQLDKNKLNGFIPTEIGNLTEAITLSFRNNELHGTLPQALKALKKLKVLDLFVNYISGDLPEWLSELSSLENLNLYSNINVTGTIPPSLLDLKLTSLDLNNTQISGTIPAKLGEMQTLTDLRLNSPNLTGEIPATLGNLTNLTFLLIKSDQRLTGSLSWVKNLKKLTWLGITGLNGLTGNEAISALVPLSNTLQILTLRNNRLNGAIPDQLGELTKLHCLDLSVNQLTGNIPNSLTNLTFPKNAANECNNTIGSINDLNLNDNALITVGDPTLRAFLDQKAPGWEKTQRILLPQTQPPTTPSIGDIWYSPQDGGNYVYVPGGEFTIGGTQAQLDAIFAICKPIYAGCNQYLQVITPTRSINVDGFWSIQTEVTNAQYRRFVEAGGYTQQDLWTKTGWQWRTANNITSPEPQYWNNAPWNLPDYPVVGVSWYEAVAYANWLARETGLHFRLPTEAEWEKAARGTNEWIYPWGNTWDGNRVNYCDAQCDLPTKNNAHNDGYKATAPAGSYPQGASPYGALDMAGNVQEWTSTLQGTDPNTQGDMEAQDKTLRVLRGGSFNSIAGLVATVLEGAMCQGPGPNCLDSQGHPDFRHGDIGFRLVVGK